MPNCKKLLLLMFCALLIGAAMVSTAYAEDLGGVSPQKALEYMQKNYPNLIIIDTALPQYYEKQHFAGAINIPANEMSERYQEIPEGAKVILHCRIGKTVLPAYRVLQQHRPDLEFSYINNAPPFEAYNKWVEDKEKEKLKP